MEDGAIHLLGANGLHTLLAPFVGIHQVRNKIMNVSLIKLLLVGLEKIRTG